MLGISVDDCKTFFQEFRGISGARSDSKGGIRRFSKGNRTETKRTCQFFSCFCSTFGLAAYRFDLVGGTSDCDRICLNSSIARRIVTEPGDNLAAIRRCDVASSILPWLARRMARL